MDLPQNNGDAANARPKSNRMRDRIGDTMRELSRLKFGYVTVHSAITFQQKSGAHVDTAKNARAKKTRHERIKNKRGIASFSKRKTSGWVAHPRALVLESL